MMGVGALMCASLLLACEVARRLRLRRAVLWALLGVPAYGMLMLGAVYGNAMLAQERYERRICAEPGRRFREPVWCATRRAGSIWINTC